MRDLSLRIIFCLAVAFTSHLWANTTIDLNGKWSLTAFEQPDSGAIRTLPLPDTLNCESYAATVPGNCELDLVRAGVLPEPEFGLNVLKLRPYEGYQWLYERTFDVPEMATDGKAVLEFDGIDTLADVFLNGEKIGEASNMFIPHRFDVTRKVRIGLNKVQVLFRSVAIEAQFGELGEIGYSMTGGADGELFRKPSSAGGWDIMPRVFCAGLWRDVRLSIEPVVRIDRTAWIVNGVNVASRSANIGVRCRVQAPFRYLGKSKLRYSVSRNGRTVVSRVRPLNTYHNLVSMWAEGLDLWWPRGMGDPALYDGRIEVLDDAGRIMATHTEKIGIRTIKLDRDDVYDAKRPGRFRFLVNGEYCYIRGTNWVPLDAFHSRDRERLLPTLELVRDLNCNMIRVWGGGVYESDEFYDWCDANGVMVWQDFMTACNAYPQSDAYAKATAEEVRSVVIRLRNHASLALWCGNNENDGAYGWQIGEFGLDPNRDRNSRKTIPEVLFEYDVTRPYLPSSPYESPDVHAGLAKPSEDHLWGARGYYKTDYYTNSPAWFASEMGYHGCPIRASLEKMMGKEYAYPWKDAEKLDWNDAWRLKACNPFFDPEEKDGLWKRNDLMTKQVKIMFGEVSRDFDTFIAQSQTVQAEALKTFIELFRSRKGTRFDGLIWWNVRDGWPILSDSVVDYYGGRKMAYYSVRNSQRDQIVCLLDDHSAWAINDTRHEVPGTACFSDVETGRRLFERRFTIPANGKVCLGSVPFDGQGVVRIDCNIDSRPYVNYFVYGNAPFDWKKLHCLTEGVYSEIGVPVSVAEKGD